MSRNIHDFSDGYAIADEYRQRGEQSGWAILGVTLRFYDTDQHRWIVEYPGCTGFHSGFTELGGVLVSETSVTLMSQAPGLLVRETYLDITDDHFTYRVDVSTDEGETWDEGVQVVEAHRIEG